MQNNKNYNINNNIINFNIRNNFYNYVSEKKKERGN